MSVRMGDGGPQSASEEAVEKHIRLDLSRFCTSRLFCPVTISREEHTLQGDTECYPRPRLCQGPLGHYGPTLSQYWQMCTQGDAYENFCGMVLMTRSREKKSNDFYGVFSTLEYYTAIKKSVLIDEVNNAFLKLAVE